MAFFANCRAKSHFQVRTSERNPIFGCPPLRCPPLGPPEYQLIFLSFRVETFFCPCSLVSEKNHRKIARNLCTHILGSPTPILCANCAGASPHKFRTIAAHFGCPCTSSHKFSGTCRECPAHKFAQFSGARGLFSKSASVQAMKCLNFRERKVSSKHQQVLNPTL